MKLSLLNHLQAICKPIFSKMNQLRAISKPVFFGIWGTAGCLAGALLGEILLAVTGSFASPGSVMPAEKPQAVCLVIDCSGSMNRQKKLREAKAAASALVERQGVPGNSFAVIGFGTEVYLATELTGDLAAVRGAIEEIADGGSTHMAAALTKALETLAPATSERNIIVFTDGQPQSISETLGSAERCRNAGIRLVAIGTKDANIGLLEEVTGDDKLVFKTKVGGFSKAFKHAEIAIYAPQLLESTPMAGLGFVASICRVAAWTALLSVGLALALVTGQNWYLRRNLVHRSQFALAVAGGALVGILAGLSGQILFSMAGRGTILMFLGRVAAWGILGALLGVGMAFFVPNLKRGRASLGGLLGGVLGAIVFLLASRAMGDWMGRLFGAIILGFFIGLMVALAEVLAKDAWLVAKWAHGEQTTILLGKRPVVIGSSPDADVYISKDMDYPDVAGTLKLAGGKVEFEDKVKSTKHYLVDGNKLVVGNITVEIHVK